MKRRLQPLLALTALPTRSALLVLLSTLVAGSAHAAEPASLHITQALAQGTAVTAYVTLQDEAGAPVALEAPGQATATLGAQVAEVVAVQPFAATGEGVLYLFLVDQSRSLDPAQFERIRQALRTWVAALGERDRAALLTFGNQVRTLVAPTADRAALTAAIDGLKPTDDRTALHQALAQGLTLGRLARRSGGLFIDASTGDPAAAYATMRERIRAVDQLELRCPTCTADGNRYRLQVAVTQNGRTLSDGMEMRLYPVTAGTGAGTPATPEAAPAGNGTPAAADPPPPDATPQPAATPPADSTPAASTPGAATPAQAEATPPAAAAPQAAPGAQPVGSAMSATSDSPPATWGQQFIAGWPWWLGGTVLALVLLGLGLSRRGRSGTAKEGAATPASPLAAGPLEVPVVTPPPATTPSIPPTSPTLAPTRRQEAPTGPILNLAFMNGPRRGQLARVTLAPDAILGRHPASSLALTGDDEVSGRHARLFVQERRLLVEDLGSTNGTWLNGIRLRAPTPVGEGDVVRCGQTELRLGAIGAS